MIFPNILKSTKWLDLSTSAKLVIIWIILESYYVIDLILDSSLIILAFYCKFVYLEFFLFTPHVFKFLSENE